MSSRELIYIAGPISPLDNGHNAIDQFLRNIKIGVRHSAILLNKGYAVYSPFVEWLLMLGEIDVKESDLKENSMEILKRCDAIYLTQNPWLAGSKGMMEELEIAEGRGIKIYKESDIP
jgi:hypothetical protein